MLYTSSTLVMLCFLYQEVNAGLGSLRMAEETGTAQSTETWERVRGKKEIIPVLRSGEQATKDDDPCFGAGIVSLQVQLWCEYYSSIGLI